MKYQVGDTVLLLHSNEEGKVVEIMNENMVMVNVEGVEFPVFTDQIDFPYFKRFSEASKKKKEKGNQKVYIDQVPKEKKEAESQKKTEHGVTFSFVPVYDESTFEDHINYFKLYIINQNNEAYHFEYTAVNRQEADFEISNNIREQSDFYLHNISPEDINDISRFRFIFSLIRTDKHKVAQLEKTVKIKARTLFQKIEEMHLKNVPSFSFDLFSNYPDLPTEEYFPVPEHIKVVEKTGGSDEPARSVIDIHIEKIIDNYTGLSNFEILQIQLDYFEKYYKLAVSAMQPKLTVIHGVGSGKLRNEIHERLRTKKEVRSFINQYHPAFGFGATEIFFQY